MLVDKSVYMIVFELIVVNMGKYIVSMKLYTTVDYS
jgi:hypothetical protein